MQVTFGDGVQGARLPTGTVNVAAHYRSGIGPDGEVDAGTLTMLRAMPLGLRGVTNPIAGERRRRAGKLADARRNAPLTLLTFERVVSLLDYENYARAYPGIGKARGDVLWVDGDVARAILPSPARPAACRARTCSTNLRVLDRRRQRSVATLHRRRLCAALFQPRRGDRGRSALSLRRRAGGVATALLAAFGFRRARSRPVGHRRRDRGADSHGAGRGRGRYGRTAALHRRPAAGRYRARRGACVRRALTMPRRDETPAELLLINPASLTLTEMTAMSLLMPERLYKLLPAFHSHPRRRPGRAVCARCSR